MGCKPACWLLGLPCWEVRSRGVGEMVDLSEMSRAFCGVVRILGISVK